MVTQKNNPIINVDGVPEANPQDADILYRKQNIKKTQMGDISEDLRTGDERIAAETWWGGPELFAISGGTNSNTAAMGEASGTLAIPVIFDATLNDIYIMTDVAPDSGSTSTIYNIFNADYKGPNQNRFMAVSDNSIKTIATDISANTPQRIPGPYNVGLKKNGVLILNYSNTGGGISIPSGNWKMWANVTPK